MFRRNVYTRVMCPLLTLINEIEDAAETSTLHSNVTAPRAFYTARKIIMMTSLDQRSSL